jgi:phage N-6-adenine-methyltransferase
MFSSASGEWETPGEFFDTLDAVFHFTLDVCATHANAKCERYYTKVDDGLSCEWRICRALHIFQNVESRNMWSAGAEAL